MTILDTDLRFLASERMTQDSDGGGRVTNDVVLDNEENGVFPDIASGDGIAGRTWLSKIFAAVRSADTDAYLAPRVFVSEPPADPNVSIALFSTESASDQRSDMANYVEAYLVAGQTSELKLIGNHVAGQQALLCYQRVSAPIPDVGDVFVLAEMSGVNELGSQYVRVVKVEHSIVDYVDGSISGNDAVFTRRQLTLSLSDPLTRGFPGTSPNRQETTQQTMIRKTMAADAARFKGIAPLTVAASAGDFTLKTSSIYSRVVPSTQAETPLIDVQAGGGATVVVSGGARSANVSIVAHTDKTLITPSGRQLNYTNLLIPKPAPSSVIVSYRALGKWYTIHDDGNGIMEGSGAGVVNYSTGSVAITLLAVPDVNSAIVWQWGSPVHFGQVTSAMAAIPLPSWSGRLTEIGIEIASVVAEWTENSVIKSAIADSNGVFSGDATGAIDSMGFFVLQPNTLPDANTTPTLRYRYGLQKAKLFTPTKDSNGMVTLAFGESIQPNSLQLFWVTRKTKTEADKKASTA